MRKNRFEGRSTQVLDRSLPLLAAPLKVLLQEIDWHMVEMHPSAAASSGRG
jgi:hypothetical protein